MGSPVTNNAGRVHGAHVSDAPPPVGHNAHQPTAAPTGLGGDTTQTHSAASPTMSDANRTTQQDPATHEDPIAQAINEQTGGKPKAPPTEKEAIAKLTKMQRVTAHEGLQEKIKAQTAELIRNENTIHTHKDDPTKALEVETAEKQVKVIKKNLGEMDATNVILKEAISKDEGFFKRTASGGAFQWITGVGGLLTGVVFLPQAFSGMFSSSATSQDPQAAPQPQGKGKSAPTPAPAAPVASPTYNPYTAQVM